MTSEDAPRYRAFISYSHQDKAVASWLHRSLEAFRVPSKLVGQSTAAGVVPRRLTPIFRDSVELPASGDLGSALRTALTGSVFLIVICSPAAATSRWVEEEVRTFKRRAGDGNVLAVLASGEPYAKASAAECFPLSLKWRLDAAGNPGTVAAEPIAADLRPNGDGKRLALLKLVAGLTGLPLDALVRREAQRRVRRLAIITGGALTGMVLAFAMAIYANARRIEANEQRIIAEREAATARATSEYMVSTFTLANPATDNPRTISALTILGRSAARARAELADQPVVQARLISTLGQSYLNLGLYDEARAAVEGSLLAVRRAGIDGVSAHLTLAFVYLKQGEFAKALSLLQTAEGVLEAHPLDHLDLAARAAVIEGQVRTAMGESRQALTAYNRAIAIYRAKPRMDAGKLAAALMNRGIILSDDGQFAEAETSLDEALALYQRVRGSQHLATGQTWFALAQNAFLAGNLVPAATRIETALAIERRMLDADNPIIADALSIKGQILQGQHRPAEAEAALAEAVTIYRHAFGKPHYLIGITEVYLALAASDRGHIGKALAILDDAKHNYDVGYGKLHANHGDLLVNRAMILAHAGRLVEAHHDCTAGIAILDQTLGPQANYTRTMKATCAKLT